MLIDHWPLLGLRLRTPRLELRVPGPDDLAALADLAAAGIHDPAVQPFVEPWTVGEPAEVARRALQWQWGAWSRWKPEEWSLGFVVVAGGTVIGTQEVEAWRFDVRREVATGSWLGRAHQGQGYGTEMRAAVLELAFAGLGAEAATSGAFADNKASLAVSRRLGYADNGTDLLIVRDQPVESRRLRLDRPTWERLRGVPVEIEGLGPCLPMFGLTGGAA